MAALSIITGGGKWLKISIAADPPYQRLLLTAEKKFWRWVSFGEPPDQAQETSKRRLWSGATEETRPFPLIYAGPPKNDSRMTCIEMMPTPVDQPPCDRFRHGRLAPSFGRSLRAGS
jgi:hypothetical protein